MAAVALMADPVRAVACSSAGAGTGGSACSRQPQAGVVVTRCGQPLATEACLLVVCVSMTRRNRNALGSRGQRVVHEPGGVSSVRTAVLWASGASDGVIRPAAYSLVAVAKVVTATCGPCSISGERRVSGGGPRHIRIMLACCPAVGTARNRCSSIVETRAIRQTAGGSSMAAVTRGKITPVGRVLGASVFPASSVVETDARVRGSIAALMRRIGNVWGRLILITALAEFVRICAGGSRA